MRNDRIIVSGYNGTIKGECNTCENKQGLTKDTVLHAEQNAISFAARTGIALQDTDLYLTLSPCITCAKLIASCGVRSVVYKEEYRETSGIEFLNKLNIVCKQG